MHVHARLKGHTPKHTHTHIFTHTHIYVHTDTIKHTHLHTHAQGHLPTLHSFWCRPSALSAALSPARCGHKDLCTAPLLHMYTTAMCTAVAAQMLLQVVFVTDKSPQHSDAVYVQRGMCFQSIKINPGPANTLPLADWPAGQHTALLHVAAGKCTAAYRCNCRCCTRSWRPASAVVAMRKAPLILTVLSALPLVDAHIGKSQPCHEAPHAEEADHHLQAPPCLPVGQTCSQTRHTNTHTGTHASRKVNNTTIQSAARPSSGLQ